MFKVNEIDRSARLYSISGHVVLLWLSTGPCWNSKADGHWQTQTINLHSSGTDRSGIRSPVISHEMILDCGQPQLAAPLHLNSSNSCSLVDSIFGENLA